MGNVIQIIIIAIGLSMDAVSVSIAIGFRSGNRTRVEAFKLAIFFGAFQAFMPLVGWLVGNAIDNTISSVNNLIGCLLLIGIGVKMLFESRKSVDEPKQGLSYRELTALGVATSIDALIVGTSIRLVHLPIGVAIATIGVITFVLCFFAYFLARHLGKLFGKKVELVGAIVLIVLGLTFLFR